MAMSLRERFEVPQKAVKASRLDGLDFARFVAFLGMVLVNFHVVMGLEDGAPWALTFLSFFEGKAAATFVVLAGVGLGLAAQRAEAKDFRRTIWRRSLFLFVVGLINSLIFPADILHYYAVYFAIGVLLIYRSSRFIFLSALALPLVFVLLLFVLDYEQGWNWATLDYAGFWTAQGFVRNLLINGWHPVVPWLSFLLGGFLVARLDLAQRRVQVRLFLAGLGMLVAGLVLSKIWTALAPAALVTFGATSPVPPMPLYILVGFGAALGVIGVSLLGFGAGAGRYLTVFSRTGRQALTLYIAHILIGMGVLEAMGRIGGQPAEYAVFAAIAFVLLCVIYVNIWAKFFRVGPIEWLMRRLAG
jgi:uncharacterized protein